MLLTHLPQNMTLDSKSYVDQVEDADGPTLEDVEDVVQPDVVRSHKRCQGSEQTIDQRRVVKSKKDIFHIY